jgi:3',5'-cyclic AMP phosphodiesterase CpdA
MSQRFTCAHLSDLHLGKTPRHARAAASLCRAIEAAGADCVIVTGDITENGRQAELAEFYRLFKPWHDRDRLVAVPGNHDRLGDNVASCIMNDSRVDCIRVAGLSVVRVNSTHWFNRFPLASHGFIDAPSMTEACRLAEEAPASDLVVVALHHHLLPLPVDYFVERMANWLRLPFATELPLGKFFLDRLQGHCDVVLHGHRHTPWEILMPGPGRGLSVFNAGSSVELGSFRLFTYEDGALVGDPVWVKAEPTL